MEILALSELAPDHICRSCLDFQAAAFVVSDFLKDTNCAASFLISLLWKFPNSWIYEVSVSLLFHLAVLDMSGFLSHSDWEIMLFMVLSHGMMW